MDNEKGSGNGTAGATKRFDAISHFRGHKREIVVPVAEMTGDVLHDLDVIFKYGQNDFQPRPCPSLSVGDLVFVSGVCYVCEPFGWVKGEAATPATVAAIKELWKVSEIRPDTLSPEAAAARAKRIEELIAVEGVVRWLNDGLREGLIEEMNETHAS